MVRTLKNVPSEEFEIAREVYKRASRTAKSSDIKKLISGITINIEGMILNRSGVTDETIFRYVVE